jgi:hypothetical protein
MVMGLQRTLLYARDLGFSTSNPEEYLDLYVRCCADSTKDPELVYRAHCADISKFGEGWDFTRDFRTPAEIEMFSSSGADTLYFGVLTPKVNALSALSIFDYSQHLPLAKLLSNYKVPKPFFGFKRELNPYVRAVKRLKKKNLRLVLDGYVTYQEDNLKSVGQKGPSGLVTVSIYLPRYDYLADHLKNSF